MERGGITIFDFLECWGHESPLPTFGMVGVLLTPLDFWEDGVLLAPLDCWDGGVLSTPLAFWDGGVVKGFRKEGTLRFHQRRRGREDFGVSGPRPQGEEVLMNFWVNAIRGEGMTKFLA